MRVRLNRINEHGTGVCLGLDPAIEKMPVEFSKLSPSEAIICFLKEVVSITHSRVSAYKVQKAFLDLYGGPELLKEIIRIIRLKTEEVPVFVDCKVGDTENTMKAYLRNIFDNADADAIVINPYMGTDIFTALKEYSDRGIAVLIRTSNKNANVIQDVPVTKSMIPFWKYILNYAITNWNENNNLIPVLSEHCVEEKIRENIPDNMPILYAGVGAQGGNLSKISCLFNKKRKGIIVSSSRALIYPYPPDEQQWKKKISEALEKLCTHIHNIRSEHYGIK
jgi:orotidine 5'-phosphate decarboxylase subfamily 2